MAQGGSTVTLENTFVSGGTLTTSGTGVIQTGTSFAGASTALQNLTNAGFYRLNPTNATAIVGTVTNTGTIARDLPGDGRLLVIPGATLVNQGTLLASNGGSVLASEGGAISNSGLFAVNANSALRLTNVALTNFDAATGTLAGGTYRVAG